MHLFKLFLNQVLFLFLQLFLPAPLCCDCIFLTINSCHQFVVQLKINIVAALNCLLLYFFGISNVAFFFIPTVSVQVNIYFWYILICNINKYYSRKTCYLLENVAHDTRIPWLIYVLRKGVCLKLFNLFWNIIL